MDMDMVLTWLVGAWPVARPILVGLGSLVVVGTILVAATPTKADDEWLAKLEAVPMLGLLIKALQKFSVLTRKDPNA